LGFVLQISFTLGISFIFSRKYSISSFSTLSIFSNHQIFSIYSNALNNETAQVTFGVPGSNLSGIFQSV
jgi:hypothetical protein